MTDSQAYACPFCDYTAGTEGSVVGHISAKTDPEHKGKTGSAHRDAIELTTLASSGDERAPAGSADSSAPAERAAAEQGSSSSAGSSAEPVTFPEAEGGGSTQPEPATDGGEGCCSSPSLEGSAGDAYRLEDGSIVQLEQGDRICVNCDEIHE